MANYQYGDSSVDVIPGTDVMRDADDAHLKHWKGSDTRGKLRPINRILYLQSLAPDIIIATQFLYTFVTVESALSLAPMFPMLKKEWDLNQTQLSLLTGACVLALGYANFLIVPFSNIFGRRLAGLSLGVLVILTELWEALATSHHSFLAARVVNGLTTATAESLMVQVIADIFFLHERGLWTGIYFTGYFFGLFLGPVIAGTIAERHGWRSFFWLSLALSVFNLITIFFLFPETNYQRSPASTGGQVKAADEPTQVVNEKTGDESVQAQNDNESRISSQYGRGRPSMKQFMPWRKPDPRWKSFLIRDILSPFRVFFYPIIFWAALNLAGPANLLLFWNLTESSFLSEPPYNFSSSGVAYSNFAFFIGGTIGLVTAGPFSDWIADRATRKNNGVREAEMRLPALIPFFITTVIGVVVGGIGYERQWAWPIILVFGYGLTGLSVTTVPTISIAYAVDCYKPISGEIMVVATVVKNTCGFSMSYWVEPLAERKGLIAPAMVEFALTVGPLVLALPLYFYGKRLRGMTRHSKVHQWSEI
ncbi:transmembrane transporter [Penicillium alfredii]|uniref:Transmembrane transporter n=1 Tax=Penicillium alfredii TaxID=1506179 RepID=A0A9W9KCZ7_9EURO|nr:transmembrane transporter [Penicillium alfredii]KAJ5101266.1 transmembrane transporter [Penicillium alfredii]